MINCPKCGSPNTVRKSWMERFKDGQLDKYHRVACLDCGKSSVTDILFQKQPARIPTCCPWNHHYAKGLCEYCYKAEREKERRRRQNTKKS